MSVKLVYCCRRKPGMSLEEFHKYWLDHHGGLAIRLREKMPGMKRYVQSHTLPGAATDMLQASRGALDPFDGITEAWFDSVESMADGGEDAQVAAVAMLKDEGEFLDLPNCVVFLPEEHEIF